MRLAFSSRQQYHYLKRVHNTNWSVPQQVKSGWSHLDLGLGEMWASLILVVTSMRSEHNSATLTTGGKLKPVKKKQTNIYIYIFFFSFPPLCKCFCKHFDLQYEHSKGKYELTTHLNYKIIYRTATNKIINNYERQPNYF